MSGNISDNGEANDAEFNAATNDNVENASAPRNPLSNESTESSASLSGAVSENNNETSTNANNNNNHNNINRNEPAIPRLNADLGNIFHARDLLQGISTRALEHAARALQRNRDSAPSASSAAQAEAAVAASEVASAGTVSAHAAVAASHAASALTASSFSPSNSSSPELSLERRLELRMAQRRERSRQRGERSEERRERSLQRRSRRRRRAQDSSSENDEATARRRRRAHNVVESLRELMLVPTSSTLGESTEGGAPRNEINAEASVRNANVGSASENPNAEGESGEGPESGNPGSRDDGNNTSSNNTNNGDGSNLPNVFRRGGERNRGEAHNNRNEDNNHDDNSDEDSINVDNVITGRVGFELGSLIDRDLMLNNLMQRSIRMLRDVEGGNSAAQRSTDLKCPVCNEIFVDYEASDHPNAPGNRSGSTLCSHGALPLFIKLHQCPICFDENIEPPNVIALACGHVVCKEDFGKLGGHVGAERPAGCPKAKPVPGRTAERSPRTEDESNNYTGSDNGSSSNGIFSMLQF